MLSYPSVLIYVLGAQKNRLIEAVILITHNIIMFRLRNKKNNILVRSHKGIYFCPIEVTSGLHVTDKGHFQYLTGLRGHQEGTYLCKTFSFTMININILSENTSTFMGPLYYPPVRKS